jgi:hypothetical protein
MVLPSTLGDAVNTAVLHRMLAREQWAFAIFLPRGIGPTRWCGDPKTDNRIRRRFTTPKGPDARVQRLTENLLERMRGT